MRLSVSLSVYASVCLCMCVFVFAYLFARLFVYSLFFYLAFSQCFSLSPSPLHLLYSFHIFILLFTRLLKLRSGRLNDEEGMRQQIDNAVGLYDSLDITRVSEHSLASAYYILATSFMTTVSTDTDSE